MVDAGPDRNITGFYAEAGRTTSNGIRKSRGTSFISELGAILTSGDMPDLEIHYEHGSMILRSKSGKAVEDQQISYSQLKDDNADLPRLCPLLYLTSLVQTQLPEPPPSALSLSAFYDWRILFRGMLC
jgi:hypothetical protein